MTKGLLAGNGDELSVRQQLLDCGADALADASLALSESNDAAADTVKRLTQSSDELKRTVKPRITGLKRRQRFIDWRESSDFANSLLSILQLIESPSMEPRTGLDLVVQFLKADGAVFERCDDSNDSISDVFRFEAADLFEHFASRLPLDETHLCDVIYDLHMDNDYGAHDRIIDSAGKYLSEQAMRCLIERFEQASDAVLKKKTANDRFVSNAAAGAIESLASQLGDAALFEKTRLANWGHVNSAVCVDVARVWLQAGDADRAFQWLTHKEATGSRDRERQELLLTVYQQLGMRQEHDKLAWQLFRQSRSADTMRILTERVGPIDRDELLDTEARLIQSEAALSATDIDFLLDSGRARDAAQVLIAHTNDLQGIHYFTWPGIAAKFAASSEHLAATLVYRALLDDLLTSGRTKAYGHGAKYLQQLRVMAPGISNWADVDRHEIYEQALREKHGRKSSFWRRLD